MDYTADAICRLLGVGPFQDEWTDSRHWIMRILFCPSFAPETCLTLTTTKDDLSVEVAAAVDQIFHLPDRLTVAVNKTRAALLLDARHDLEIRLFETLARGFPAGAMIDGMPTHIYFRRFSSEFIMTNVNPGATTDLSRFLAHVISLARDFIADPACKNVLADVGRYVGLDLPKALSPASKPRTVTIVLGSPDDKSEIMTALATTIRQQQSE